MTISFLGVMWLWFHGHKMKKPQDPAQWFWPLNGILRLRLGLIIGKKWCVKGKNDKPQKISTTQIGGACKPLIFSVLSRYAVMGEIKITGIWFVVKCWTSDVVHRSKWANL
jgi:hypothetical protein